MNDKEFYDITGYKHQLTKKIAQGGQGAVFRTANADIAIKLEMLAGTEDLILDLNQNKKFDDVRFLPIRKGVNITLPLITLRDCSGYVMNLLGDMDTFDKCFEINEDAFEALKATQNLENIEDIKEVPENDWLTNCIKQGYPLDMIQNFYSYICTGGKRRRLIAYYKIACIFSQIHSKGLVFCDFSPNNAFISNDLDYCNVWLIDADNLNFQKHTQKHVTFFTPRFVAPEIFNGKFGCNIYSDDYSFAISLFIQLTGTHPFAGKKYNGEVDDFDDDFDDDFNAENSDEQRDAGVFPWIYDKEDEGNSIDMTTIPHQPLLSEEIINAFDQTFSETGKKNITTRTSSFEWAWLLAKELDNSLKCPNCKMDSYYKSNKCDWCDCEVAIISAKSYIYVDGKKGSEIWTFNQEWIDEKILPLRLIYGHRSNCEDDAILGVIKKDGDYFKFCEFATDCNVYKYNDDGSKTAKTGNLFFENKKSCFIIEEVKHNITIFLEVNFS